MYEAIVVTPVKDSLETTKKTISAISQADGNFEYYVFNDFSKETTLSFLENSKIENKFNLVNLSEHTNQPSPNYKLVLEMAQKMALEKKLPLIIVESDVVVQSNTLKELVSIMNSKKNAGMVGAITVDEKGNYNFPYNNEKNKSDAVEITPRSLSFCCTLISAQFLSTIDFNQLSKKKDWYDIYISRQSKKNGFENYLAKGLEVLHLPHSSRPWKQLKYTSPYKYYLNKILNRRDRI